MHSIFKGGGGNCIKDIKMGNKDDTFAKSFKASLRKWGGYNVLSIDDDSRLITKVSEHVAGIYPESMIPRRYREEGREDEWRQVAHATRDFLHQSTHSSLAMKAIRLVGF